MDMCLDATIGKVEARQVEGHRKESGKHKKNV